MRREEVAITTTGECWEHRNDPLLKEKTNQNNNLKELHFKNQNDPTKVVWARRVQIWPLLTYLRSFLGLGMFS